MWIYIGMFIYILSHLFLNFIENALCSKKYKITLNSKEVILSSAIICVTELLVNYYYYYYY